MIFIKSTESVVKLAVKGGGQHREQHFSLEFLSLLSSLSHKNKKKGEKKWKSEDNFEIHVSIRLQSPSVTCRFYSSLNLWLWFIKF